MKKITGCFIFLLFINCLCFAQDIRQPTPPTPPTVPNAPVVPGVSSNTPSYPRFPTVPSIPNTNNQDNGPVRIIEEYDLTVSNAFPQGNTSRNVANTIRNAQYKLYSNNTVTIKLDFINGLEYTYHLRSQRSRVEIRPGVFRETYETVVQIGNEFSLEQCSSELIKDGNSIH